MLNTKDVMATIAVKDMAIAKQFYGETLGFAESGSMDDMMVAYKSGNSTLVVYRSEFAGTNQATSATWVVGDDLDTIISALKAKGVTFEHYSFPNMKVEGDIHVTGNTRVAWFKDPDGNILNIGNGKSDGI